MTLSFRKNKINLCAGVVGTLGNSDHDGDTVQVIFSDALQKLYDQTRDVRSEVPRRVLEHDVARLIPKTATKFQSTDVYYFDTQQLNASKFVNGSMFKTSIYKY